MRTYLHSPAPSRACTNDSSSFRFCRQHWKPLISSAQPHDGPPLSLMTDFSTWSLATSPVVPLLHGRVPILWFCGRAMPHLTRVIVELRPQATHTKIKAPASQHLTFRPRAQATKDRLEPHLQQVLNVELFCCQSWKRQHRPSSITGRKQRQLYCATRI